MVDRPGGHEDSTSIRSMGAVVDTLGQRELEDAAREFEKRWGDSRYVIGRDEPTASCPPGGHACSPSS
ncbi:hypothetical protein C1A38_16295, partial [Verrucosispora sp. ts21]